MRFRLILDVVYEAEEGSELPDAESFHRTISKALAKFAKSPRLTKGLEGVRVDQVAVGAMPVPPGVPTPREALATPTGPDVAPIPYAGTPPAQGPAPLPDGRRGEG